ncbi:hypothetical protein PanWU01x14_282610 [Parasponia andersonii]|uniref:Uncharacterized protein n=1 Tax=Parasponia andersonii TaxID=3476 RepID=A0A2P5B0L6_PARAD|nr:hypothetical protein PanWU01x14_282610 [Parasponia andersonii]
MASERYCNFKNKMNKHYQDNGEKEKDYNKALQMFQLSYTVRDLNSICPGSKISRCDICCIFVIKRNFKICGGSGGIGPISPIPELTTDLVGGAGVLKMSEIRTIQTQEHTQASTTNDSDGNNLQFQELRTLLLRIVHGIIPPPQQYSTQHDEDEDLGDD